MNNFSYGETLLKAEGITHIIDGKVILKNLSVEIKNIIRPGMEQGQIVSVLAPSGVGKSQLFNVLSGITKPIEGTVLLHKQTGFGKVHIGDVGMVQQHYPLFNHRTIKSNLEVAVNQIEKLTDSEKKDRIIQIADQVNMLDHLSKYPPQLSGGQRQRIAIAQQLLRGHTFLLLDEPTSGLDILAKEKILHILADLVAKNELLTIVIISHDIKSSAMISDTIWIMGRDRDSTGKIINGAYIKHTYDLAQMGFAWRNDLNRDQRFLGLVEDINLLFQTL